MGAVIGRLFSKLFGKLANVHGVFARSRLWWFVWIFRQEGDADIDGGLGRCWKNNDPLQTEIRRSRDDHSHHRCVSLLDSSVTGVVLGLVTLLLVFLMFAFFDVCRFFDVWLTWRFLCSGFNVETVEYKNISFTVWWVWMKPPPLPQSIWAHCLFRFSGMLVVRTRSGLCGVITTRILKESSSLSIQTIKSESTSNLEPSKVVSWWLFFRRAKKITEGTIWTTVCLARNGTELPWNFPHQLRS